MINYDANTFFGELQKTLPDNFSLYLTKNSGEYLINPEASKTFSSDLNTDYSWTKDFKDISKTHSLPKDLLVKNYNGQHFLVKSKVLPIYQGINDKSLTVKLAIPENFVFSHIIKNVFIDILAMFVSVLALSGLLYFYRLTRVEQQRISVEQARSAAIVEGSQDAIIGITLDGHVTDWNKGAEYIFGYNAQEVLGKPVLDLIIPYDKKDEELLIYKKIKSGQHVSQLNSKRQCKDGSLVDASITVSPIRNKEGEIVGAAKIIRDISQQKAIEEELCTLNASLEEQVAERTAEIQHYLNLQSTILKQAHTAIIITDTKGTITLFNPAAEKMLGYVASEVIDKLNYITLLEKNEIIELVNIFSNKMDIEVEPSFKVLVLETQYSLHPNKEWMLLKKNKIAFPAYQEITPLLDAETKVTGYLFIATDMSQQVADRIKLENMKDQLVKASEVAKLGIWTWDVRTNELEWNPMMYEMYGVKPKSEGEKLTFNTWFESLHPDDKLLMQDKVKKAISEGIPFDPIFRIVRNDGEIRYIKSDATIEHDITGSTTIMLGINRDITDQLRKEQQLRNAKQMADKANIAKSEFVANMSHEIRTPMNAILGMVQLLKKTKLENKQVDYLLKTESAAKVLLGILNDILDFSKMEAGKLVLDPHTCHVDQLLRNVSTITSVNIGQKNIEVLFDIDHSLPSHIMVDELRLQQVLINLTSNAIKFTHEGEVVLSVQVLEKNNSDTLLKFSVQDTGIGISQENLEHIFNVFSQAEASTTRRFGGTGLGLAICQRLVTLMGGKLVVESKLDHGSKFSFTIPCKAVEPSSHLSVIEAKGKLLSLQNFKLLIIDDNDHVRTLLTKMAQALGWQADAIKSGQNAINKLQSEQYNCIIIDTSMPDMDGFETIRYMKSFFPENCWPIVIMMTVHQTKELLDRLSEYKEIQTVLTKPVTASTLFDAVLDAVKPAEMMPSNEPEIVSERLKSISILLAEDNLTNQQVAKELLELEGAKVDVVSDGLAAVNTLKRSKNDFDVVLMDIQMPTMDGYNATKEIRNNLDLKTLPIIAMTANAMQKDKEKALSIGMNNYIAKPFELEQVVSTILNEVSKYHDTSNQNSGKQALTQAASATPLLDEQEALARMGGVQRIYQKALNNYLQEIPTIIEQLPLDTNLVDPEVAARKLHTIKGMAATVGAKAVAQLSESLEKMIRNNDQSDYSTLIKRLKELIESTNSKIEKRSVEK
uniref:response regulator n=1 Tax=Zooshikella ganghwensis TaxID=202772 RepID=UPI002D7FDD45|nr:response regulator [Zooshikella ganghwensis]